MRVTARSQGFAGIKVEGGILSSEFLNSVASLSAPKQSGIDYGLSKSLSIKEELARFWRIGHDLYGRYAERRPRADLPATQVGIEEWLVPFFRSLLGYEDIAPIDSAVIDDRVYKLSHRACGTAVPLLFVTRDFDLDRADQRLGYDGRQQAPHGTMQEYLNAEDRVLWGVISNGSKLRILRDNPSLSRPSYLEVDLELIFEEDLYPDFTALWLTAHASRLNPIDEKPTSCIIELWRATAHETGERAKESLRDGVTESLKQLGNGFLQHPKNTKLSSKLIEGTITAESYFQELLRLVYRMLFLFTTEERNILHSQDSSDLQRAVFREGYSLSRLRDKALRRRNYDQNHDLWSGLQVTFAALAEGADGLGLPALGGLFRSDQCPDLDEAFISNDLLLMSIRTLAFFRSEKVFTRVNYRDMDSEELGSIYESLLELRPDIEVDTLPWKFSLIGGETGAQSQGSKRKLTGSYYTPSSLVNELVKSTLEPVITAAVKSHPDDPHAAILGLNIIDPACGSGHFLLAAARRLATEIARLETGVDTLDESARRHALREVVQQCIYGVDRNPLAVELCKTALWIETIEPGKPLTFLDAHVVHGDSLVGILDPRVMISGIPQDAFKALAGDDKDVCVELRARNKNAGDYGLFDQLATLEVAVANIDLDSMPEDTLADVEQKRSAWQSSLSEKTRAREEFRANIFLSAFFAPKTRDELETVPQTQDLYRLDEARPSRLGVEECSRSLAEKHCFLHWHLTFADVMQNGGFDVVLGNPPWERIKLQDQEFFATRSKDIATAPNKAARDRLIERLRHVDALPIEKSLYGAFESAKHEAEAISQFVRKSGRFELTNVGDVNTYAVFAETCLQILHPHGRAGLIVPTGIATDDTTKTYFKHLVNRKQLVSLFDFENREAVFPSVHRSYKFCMLSLTGRENPVNESEFAFFLHQVNQIKEDRRRFVLTLEDFELFNPNTRTCPIFRTGHDMSIAKKMYQRAGVFWREKDSSTSELNPWGVSFQRMFDMSMDSGMFKTYQELSEEGWELEGNEFVRGEERYWPLYEAKLFHQYDNRFATFEGVSELEIRKGNPRPMSSIEKKDPAATSIPRYWVPAEEVLQRLNKAKPSQAKPSQILYSPNLQGSRGTRSPKDRKVNGRTNQYLCHAPQYGARRFRDKDQHWLVAFRDISSPTNRRTAIFTFLRKTATNHKSPIMNIDYDRWLQVIRGITTSTNERTIVTGHIQQSGAGHNAPTVRYESAQAIASTLVLANMNSLPLDWAARMSVGGMNMSFFIVKQLPVLPPEAYLEKSRCGKRFVSLIVPRVMELTFTSDELTSFARALGYDGAPFEWDEARRHRLRADLDAIYAEMYGLSRSDVEWILDAPSPSASFPTLREHEMNEFGEYRTERFVLEAFDILAMGHELEY